MSKDKNKKDETPSQDLEVVAEQKEETTAPPAVLEETLARPERLNDRDAETISSVETPEILQKPAVLPVVNAPRIGDKGCFRNGRGEPCLAFVLRVRKEGSKTLVHIVYFDDVVQTGFVQDVEIGTGIRQYWHSLREVEDILAAQRDKQFERTKLPASVSLPGGTPGQAASFSAR